MVPPSGPPPVYGCPVDAPVSVVGGKWKLVILFYLLQQPRRTGELRRIIPQARRSWPFVAVHGCPAITPHPSSRYALSACLSSGLGVPSG